MEEILNASYAAGLELGGRKTLLPMKLTARPGENIFLHGSEAKRAGHFDVLCGLKKPDMGGVTVLGQDLYAGDPASFRRDNIGGIPRGGGLIPEIPMMDQVTLPMVLAGEPREAIQARLRELASEQMPLHRLYGSPRRSSLRRQAFAVLLRALVRKPKLLVIDGFLEEWDDLDGDALWGFLLEHRPEESVLLYLSGGPAPEQVQWTQQRSISMGVNL